MRVLVVIPCYRQAHLLSEAIASVAAQTHLDLECIVVDDGSPDDTAAVTRRLMKEHPWLKLIRQENAGPSAARNNAIAASDAPLILPLDADDKLVPTALEKMVAVFEERPELAIVGCWAREFGNYDDTLRACSLGLRRLLKGNTICGTSMFRRDVFEKTAGYNPNMLHGYEDWDLWISLHEVGGEAHVIEEELFWYRQAGPSRNDVAEQRHVWLRARIVLNHPDLYEPSRVRLAEQTLQAEEPGFLLRLRWILFLLKDYRARKAARELASLLGFS
ncbi:MAG: glycosyltransferase family 2 protein [Planctomycetota bacterium]|jgi:glycosyltransferase involved in cell wall biosynthesis